MGLWITLRQNKENSFFRQHLLNMISDRIDGDSLILAYGYFQEEVTSQQNPKKYSTSEDLLIDAIIKNEQIQEIRVIGAKGSSGPFNRFCNKLQTQWRRPPLRQEIKGKNWHAKVAMKLKTITRDDGAIEKRPVCAIIGSSNLTRPAYGTVLFKPRQEISKFNHFNHECDVVIFVNEDIAQDNFTDRKSHFFPGFEKQEYGSIYFEKLPPGTDELQQLSGLLNDIDACTKPAK
jgi:hypothetical protein